MKKILDRIDLPDEVKEGIRSRASMLSHTLKTIPEEDLVQEGLLLVYTVIHKKPTASIPYIMKAINNHYADIQNKEVERKVLTIKSLDTGNVERELDAQAYRTFQRKQMEVPKRASHMRGKNAGMMEAIETLKEKHELTFKDIAEYTGKSTKTIRGLLRKHGKEKEKE